MPMYDDIDKDQDHNHDFEQKFEHNFYQNVDSTENFILSTENLEGGKNIWENYIFLWSGEISCCAKSTKTKV